MKTVRISIRLPDDLLEELSRILGPGKRSRFIAEAVGRSLKEHRGRRLGAEYEAACQDISRVNAELATTVGDGVE